MGVLTFVIMATYKGYIIFVTRISNITAGSILCTHDVDFEPIIILFSYFGNLKRMSIWQSLR